jgi:dihydroneopterin aldolase
MTDMLASVIDSRELELAIQAGTDIIDLKNPHTGALGALSPATISHLVRQCAGRRPVSATVGDLPPDPRQLTHAITRTAESGVDFVKVGFFSTDNLTECLQAISALTDRIDVVAVLFADLSPPLQRLTELADAGLRGVMLDTAGKGGGGLLSHIALDQLDRFISKANSFELLNGLAGSLTQEDIPRLLPLLPDYLGFRGALCKQRERTAEVDPQRICEIRKALNYAHLPVDQKKAASIEVICEE